MGRLSRSLTPATAGLAQGGASPAARTQGGASPGARVPATARPCAAVVAVVAPVAAVAALAGCGGGAQEQPRGTVTVGSGQTIEVSGDEYFFAPKAVVRTGRGETIPMPVRLAFRNRGSLAHNLTVFAQDRRIGGTPTLEEGRAMPAELDLAPGTYRLVCTVGNHEELGMVGTLEVR